MKFAKQSFGQEPYPCQKPWPEAVFVQCGGHGIVFQEGSLDEVLGDKAKAEEALIGALGGPVKRSHYRTAFFEACPQEPACFIRGEGSTIAEAEAAAWAKYQKIINCPEHEFERRGREDGYGYCKHCPYSSMVLDPLTNCVVCLKPAHYSRDLKQQWYCAEHYYQLKVEDVWDPHSSERGLFSAAELKESFLQSQVLDHAMRAEKVPTDLWEQVHRQAIHWSARVEYELKKAGKTADEVNTVLLDQTQVQLAVEIILKRLKGPSVS